MVLWFFCGLLLCLAIIDWRIRRIPHPLTVMGSGGAIVLSQQLPAQFTVNALAGLIICFALFLGILTVAAKRYGTGAFGFGDVMLAALIGSIAGVEIGLQALAVGMLLAGGASAAALFLGKATRHDTLPYGTFLALGALIRVVIWQLG